MGFDQTDAMTHKGLSILIGNKKKLAAYSMLWLAALSPLILFSIYYLDQPMSQYFGKDELQFVWLIAREITNIGLGEHYFGFCFLSLAFIYFIRPKLKNSKTRFAQFLDQHEAKLQYLKVWTWNLLAALLTAGLSLRILKIIFGRQRPHKSDIFDAQVFHFFENHWDFQSLPSGHTQVLFTVATLLAMWNPKQNHQLQISWFWFLVAGFFASTRVLTLDHFLSDCLLGALVGYLGALWGVFLMKKHSRHKLF